MRRSYGSSPSVLRLGMPYRDGDGSHPFGLDVQSRVQIPVVYRSTPTRPDPFRKGEGLIDGSAFPAQFAAGKEAVNHAEVFAMPNAFVLQLPAKLTQGSIQHRFGQLGFRHPFEYAIIE